MCLVLTDELKSLLQPGEEVSLVSVGNPNLQVLQLGREETGAVVGDIEDSSHPQLPEREQVAGVLGTPQDEVGQEIYWRSVAIGVIYWSRLEFP